MAIAGHGKALIQLGRVEEGVGVVEEALIALSGLLPDDDPRVAKVISLLERARAGQAVGEHGT